MALLWHHLMAAKAVLFDSIRANAIKRLLNQFNPMFQQLTLTMENWQSELRRLELSYRHIRDRESAEAKAITNQMNAVRQIIQEIAVQPGKMSNERPANFTTRDK